LDVKEEQVWLVLRDSLYGFKTIRAFRNDAYLGMGLQQFAKDVTSELLVVNNERAYFVAGQTGHR
jgi:hypothetical protein